MAGCSLPPSEPAPRGRGTGSNPPSRFIPLHHVRDPDLPPEEASHPATVFFRDATRSIIATNDSPDVGFTHSVNPYRGCEHGCSYCYARPFHEYLSFSAGLDFETRIMVKEDAPELLRRELSRPGWQPVPLAFSGVTDCYQPIERQSRLTRRCLEVCAEFRNPVGIITKSALVARDTDILAELARHQAASVTATLTTLDPDLAGRLEPRAARPTARLAALARLHQAGVPVGVMAAPIIPGLTDHEIPAILQAAREAGARFAGYVILRLPGSVAPLFDDWLAQHRPGSRERVLGRLRAMKGGQLNDARFGQRMRGSGPIADSIRTLFHLACRRLGLNREPLELSTAAFRRPGPVQRTLFDEDASPEA